MPENVSVMCMNDTIVPDVITSPIPEYIDTDTRRLSFIQLPEDIKILIQKTVDDDTRRLLVRAVISQGTWEQGSHDIFKLKQKIFAHYYGVYH